jgi:hypothetical protein
MLYQGIIHHNDALATVRIGHDAVRQGKDELSMAIVGGAAGAEV